MRDVGMFAWFSYDLPLETRLELIKNAGFAATALGWGFEGKDSGMAIANRLGLAVDTVHAPFEFSPNALWTQEDEGERYLAALCDCVRSCAYYGAETVVIHIDRLYIHPSVTDLGLMRIERLVSLAEAQGVRLAFENLGSVQTLARVFSEFPSEFVGFCYDSGHAHCALPGEALLSRFGGRLFAVHIHDNDGASDAHLLPFDGTIDWPCIRHALDESRPIPYLTLEADFDDTHPMAAKYRGLGAEVFVTEACARAQRLLSLCTPPKD